MHFRRPGPLLLSPRPTVAGSLAVCATALVLVACGSSVPRQPPGEPPTPGTVSIEEPGGDAHDPHYAALVRNVNEPWGRQADKDGQLILPLPDAGHWKRVRFWGFDHFTGFRYGDEHHVIAIVFLIDDKEDLRPNSRLCIKRFETWARPQIKGYDVKLGEIGERESKWRNAPLIVHYMDGSYVWGFSEHRFSTAWAAYPAYPETCLVYSMAVPWDDFGDAARAVRDRWVREAFERVIPVTKERPFRHPEPP